MTVRSDDDGFALQLLKGKETVMIDGFGACKWQRAMIGDEPAIIMKHPDIDKTVVITGQVLAGINGWLARSVRELKEAQARLTRH